MRLSRHDHLDCIFFSQATDFDITIRRLSSACWVVKKGIVFSSLSKFVPIITADELTGDIVSKWQKCIAVPFLTHKWVYRPRWYKEFNSWSSKTKEKPPHPNAAAWRENHGFPS